MKQRVSKRFCQFLAALLCISMLLPLIPASAFAAQTGGRAVTVSQSQINTILDYYPGGTKSGTMEYDCGNGVTGGGEKSSLTVVTDTTADHFAAFQANLKNAGYTAQSEHTVPSGGSAPNAFGSYLAPDGSYRVYTYHFPGYGESRIIVDTEQRTVNGFTYEPQSGVTVEPKLVMWGLPMSPNGHGYSERVSADHFDQRNCGAMVVIRMPDNSLFIHDGGDVEQWNNDACDQFVEFCRELTRTPAGEKMIINTWFLSHAHVDHFQGFYRLMNLKHDEFELKNIMYNIDLERENTDKDISGVLGMLKGFYPHVQYYKPHTGEVLNIAGVQLDVLYALEDRYLPNSSGKLITDTDNKGGTYRADLFKSNGDSDFNDTTTVLKVTFANGVSSILYGDLTRAKNVLLNVYADSILKTDIMMVPHHGYNDQADLVNKADAKVYLYTQHKDAVYGPDGDVSTVDLYGTYRESLRDKFIVMFPDMCVPAGTENVNYDIFWAGNETVTIDVNKLGNGDAEYYTTRDAMRFAYTGWDILDLSSDPAVLFDTLLGVSGQVSESAVVTTTTTYRYNPVGTGSLMDNVRYVIKHKQSGNIMSYDAVAVNPGIPNKAGSLRPVAENAVDAEATGIYYENSKGVYIPHNDRALAMWILNQEGTADNATLVDGSGDGDVGPWFRGVAYGEVWLNKGNATEWNADGSKGEGRNGVYWTATYGQDNNNPVTQYRFLDVRYIDENWVKTSAPTGDDATNPKKRYIIEDLGNGDFLIYWSSESGKTVSFLTCDEDGNWGVKKYTATTGDIYPAIPAAGTEELERLKLKFYQYKTFDDKKKVSFTGSKEYTVTHDATMEQVVSYIVDNITLKDTTRNGFGVPCSGTTPKIGSYYLKFDSRFSSGSYDTYTVRVMYRNDDNTDTEITALTVNVQNRKLAFAGTTTFYVSEGVREDAVRNQIVNNISVTATLSNTNGVFGTETIAYSAVPTGGKYWLAFDEAFDSSAAGDHDYLVTVNYRQCDGTDIPVETVVVNVDEVISAFTEPENKQGMVMVNAALGTVVVNEEGEHIAMTINGKEKMVSVGMLTKDGKPVDTSKEGTYEGLTLTYGKQVICSDFVLTVTKGDKVLNYPSKGEPGYVGVSKDGTTTVDQFSENGVANIELSASGIPVEKGVDIIVIMDLSGSMLYGVEIHGNASRYEDTRIYALENSLREMIKTMQTSGVDVRIAMSDFGDLDHFEIEGSVIDESIAGKSLFDVNFNNGKLAGYGEFANHLNYVMKPEPFGFSGIDVHDNPFGTYAMKFDYADNTYTDVIVPTVYTGSGEVDAEAFISVDTLYDGNGFTPAMDSIIAKMDENVSIGYGTNYDVGLEYAYYLGYAIQQDNIAKGADRDIICVFMSDGAPMQYNYFSGTSHGAGWADWISGRVENLYVADYSVTNKPEGLEGIEQTLLTMLKNGTLERPEYQRDKTLNGNIYPTVADAVAGTNSFRAGTKAYDYYLYREYVENDTDQYFYEYMARQSYDLDWDYLCDIARANGIEDFDLAYYRNDQFGQELLDLFLDKSNLIGYERQKNENGEYVAYAVYRTKLINPTMLEEQYYQKCSYTGDDFFAAMRSIGIECTWDMFAKIAWKNRLSLTKTLEEGTKADNEHNDLVTMLKLLRTVPAGYTHQTLSPYSYFYNAQGRNWWAEAIKGDSDKLYPVINKYAQHDSEDQPYTYYGDVRDNYNGQRYMAGYRGLDIDMYTVSFSVAADNEITAADAEHVLQRISSNTGSTGSFFFSAGSEEALTGALKSIVSTMSAGATGAYFTDTMGDDYDLYTGQVAGVDEVPTIKVQEYGLDGSGNQKLINVRETITFAPKNGTIEAYSDQIFTVTTVNGSNVKEYPNIWDRKTGLIRGKYVIYNTNTYVDETNTGTVDLYLDNTGRKFELKAETFFWTIGKLGETKMVLEYQVYLTGARDDSKELPFARQYYDTNEEAKLQYVNYLGNPCWLPTKTPKYPWGGGATEDVVVVDFGLPVNINVLANDTQFTNPSLKGISTDDEQPTQRTTNLAAGFGIEEIEDKYGFVSITADHKLQYRLKTMSIPDAEVFCYALQQGETANDAHYYYGTVKVIPATTIYYEEDFLTYSVYQYASGSSAVDITNRSGNENYIEEEHKNYQWTDGTATDRVQDEDRPGDFSVENEEDRPGDFSADSIDADNLYGYDSAYIDMRAYSMGCAKKFTASYVDGVRTYGTATFCFTGTGFDVISLSSGQTGTIAVQVTGSTKDENGNVVSKSYVVDTYYGYVYNASTGKWEISQKPTDGTGENTNTLYQVPVIKSSNLPNDTYTVTITASYNDFFGHGQYKEAKYDFYLDAIRIYDPADDGANNPVIEDAYIADDEGWPDYFELRNLLITKKSFDSLGQKDSIDGIIFIDGNSALSDTNNSGNTQLPYESAQIADYANYGPNNELYLAPGQAIAFDLSVSGTDEARIASIQLALKSVGETATVRVYNAADANLVNVLNGKAEDLAVDTATDLYYDITDLNNKTVVIMNNGEPGSGAAILSITNIKVTYTADPDRIENGFFSISRKASGSALYAVQQLLSSEGEQDPVQPAVGTIDLKGASLSFEDEILTNLYYTVSGIETTEMGLLTWASEPADGTIDNAEQVYVGARYVAEKGQYMVQTSGIAAKNLGDDIYMRVYAKTENGIVYSDVVTYSPKQYALSRLEKSTDEKMKALCVAMLNYGAAAQEYFGYKTGDLMNASLTAAQQALVSAYSADLFAGAVAADGSKIGSFARTAGFSGKSASVSFEGAFAINYYFSPDAAVAGEMKLYIWDRAAYASAAVLTGDNASRVVVMEQQPDGSYWGQVSGIAAKALDDTYYVAGVYTDAQGNTCCTGVIAYSLSRYCVNNANGAMGALAQATAIYGYHAKEYFDMEG